MNSLQNMADHQGSGAKLVAEAGFAFDWGGFKPMFDLCPDAILVIQDQRFVFANPAALALVGASSAGQLIGHPIEEFVALRYQLRAKERMARVLAGLPTSLDETELRRLDGSTLLAELKAGPFEWHGRPAVQVLVRDITERKQVAEKLHETEMRLSAELEAMNRLHQLSTRLLAVRDLNGGMEEVLQAAMRLMGADMGNVRLYDAHRGGMELVAQCGFGSGFCQRYGFVPVDAQQACAISMRKGQSVFHEDVLLDPGYVAYREIAETAGYRSVQSAPLLSSEGELLGILSTHCHAPYHPSEHQMRMLDLYAHQARELIVRLRMEQALRDSETRIRQLADVLPALIWQFDQHGQVVYLNQYCLDVTGSSQDQMLASAWTASVHPDELPAYQAALETALRQRSRIHTRLRVRMRNGVWSWLDVQCSPWFAPGGEYRGHVGIGVDIQEVVQAEQALKDADRRKDEFLATLAHELRNPLAPISSAVQLMQRPHSASLAERLVGIVDRQVHHIVRLVDDLMEVSRITRGQVQLNKSPLALVDIINSAVETSHPLIEQAQHRLTVSLPEDICVLDADKVRLTQVFANLLNNAANYTEPGGRICLSAEPQERWVLVRVSDNGIGIPADKLDEVFNMFSQVQRPSQRNGGLGIGLTMVRSLVELHGGSVEARSAGLGLGSEFLVRLPLLQRAAAPVADGAGKILAGPLCGRRILVVDDNHDAADSLALLLSANGGEVEVAYEGGKALQLLAARRERPPHVVLLDLGMPGMDGYEVAYRIRQQGHGLRIIALTGWGQEQDRLRTHRFGFDHHLTKPVDFDALQSLLLDCRTA